MTTGAIYDLVYYSTEGHWTLNNTDRVLLLKGEERKIKCPFSCKKKNTPHMENPMEIL